MKSQLLVFLLMSVSALSSFSDKSGKSLPDAEITGNQIDKELLLDLVNDVRTNGCFCGADYYLPVEPVSWNDTLEDVAKEHSNDMYFKRFFNHIGSDGSNPGERLSRHGYRWSGVGENLAMNYKTEEKVFYGWMGSYGHCKNIMNARYRNIGIAHTGYYWTMVLAS